MQSLFAPEDTVCFAFIKKDLPTKHIFAPAAEAFTQKAFAVLREQNETYNVFIAMNTFKPELIGQNVGRTKENVLGIKRLYADADVNGEVALENILVSSKVPPPNVVLNTSLGKYQFIWNVSDLTQQTAEPLLSAIAEEFKTDPAVAEISRVLRVPGLKNRKYAEAPEITIVREIEKETFTPTDFSALNVKPEEISKPEIQRNAENLVPVGYIHPFMVSVAGKLRNAGLTPEEIQLILLRRVHEECATPPNGFDDSKIVAVARSMANYEQGKNTDLLILPQKPENDKGQQQTADVSNWHDMFRSVEEMEEGPIVMVIEGVLQEGTCFIGANPGDGKTLLGLAFAKAISTGEPLFGLGQYSVPQVRTVIYLIPETRDRAFRKRCEAFRMPKDKMKFMARTISAGVPLELGDPYLLEAVRETKPVVFLDTASRFMKSADENAAAQNRQLVNDVITLLAAGAVCVVLIHHATKASRQEAMSLENMLRGSSDLGAMCDQAYGIRKDMPLYDYGSGPMEIDLVSLKDREQIGGLTNIRLAASYKKDGMDYPGSYINETGNFKVVSSSETWKRDIDALLAFIKSDPNVSEKKLAEKTGLSVYTVGLNLKQLGWHRVQGGKGGASPWHQDTASKCPYTKPTEDKKGAATKQVAEAVKYLRDLLRGTKPDGEHIAESEVYQGADKLGLPDAAIAKARKRLDIIITNKQWSLPAETEDQETVNQ